MFSTEEQPLLTGIDADVQNFAHSDCCMVIDWRSTEDEALAEMLRFLTAGTFTYETTFPGEDSVAIRLRFQDREDFVTLPFKPQNNFRVLLRAGRLVQPDYEIMLFRCTDGDDTNSFLLRPASWRMDYRANYPKQYEKFFRDFTDLQKIWHLDKPASGRPDIVKRLDESILLKIICAGARLFGRKRPKTKRGANNA